MNGDSEPSALTIQLLSWVASKPRSYGETMEAWRTSCPRMPIWEDAVSDGLVALDGSCGMKTRAVVLTDRGRALLEASACSGEVEHSALTPRAPSPSPLVGEGRRAATSAFTRVFDALRRDGVRGRRRRATRGPSSQPSPTRARACGTGVDARGERECTEFAAGPCSDPTGACPNLPDGHSRT
jgi:hypothetical protein